MSSRKLRDAYAARLGRVSNPLQHFHSRPGEAICTGFHALDGVKYAPVRLGELVEIVGVSSSGKTVILHSITAQALHSRDISKRNAVIWFDLNGAFDQSVLRKILTRRLREDRSEDSVAEGLINQSMSALRVAAPESTTALTDSILALPSYLKSEDGCGVKTVVIDALGSFHYTDKYEAGTGEERGNISADFSLIEALKVLLALRKVTIYVSKCALFNEERLSIKWPFPDAGIPKCPLDIMPAVWKSIVAHVVLVYHIKNGSGEQSSTFSQRAVVSMIYRDGPNASRQLIVCAASTMTICEEGVIIPTDSLHVAATQ